MKRKITTIGAVVPLGAITTGGSKINRTAKRVLFMIAMAVMLGMPTLKPTTFASAQANQQRFEQTSPFDFASLDAQSPIIVTGFLNPESVVHDEVSDVYLVSNVNGPPFALDNNGFISRVSPDGTILELKWIEGGAKGVTLNGPKGMAIHDDLLWVADINTVRTFDLETGAPLASYPAPNPFEPNILFLNDVAVAPNGTAFVTDSLNSAIFKISTKGEVSIFATAPELGFPNGVLAHGANNVSWVTWSSNQVVQINRSGRIHTVATLPDVDVSALGLPPGTLRLDGYVQLPDGSRLVSSWVTGKVYEINPCGKTITTVASFVSLLENPSQPDGPADINLDTTRNRLLVPLFGANRLVIQPLN